MDIEEILYTYPDDKVDEIFKSFKKSPQEYRKEITEGIKVCKTALKILKEIERLIPYILKKDPEVFFKHKQTVGKIYQVLGVFKQVLDFISYITTLEESKFIPIVVNINRYAKEKKLKWPKDREKIFLLFGIDKVSKKWKDRLNFLESLPISKYPYTTEELRLPTPSRVPKKGYKREGDLIRFDSKRVTYYSPEPMILTERDHKILGAINKIFREQETFDIKTSYYEIAKEINKPFGGNTKKQILESLIRLSRVEAYYTEGARKGFKRALLRFVNEFIEGENGELIIRMGLLNWYPDPKELLQDLIQLPEPTINSPTARRIYRELYSHKDKTIKMYWRNFVNRFTEFDTTKKWKRKEEKVKRALEELHNKRTVFYAFYEKKKKIIVSANPNYLKIFKNKI